MKTIFRFFFVLLLVGLVVGTLYYLYVRSKPVQIEYKTTQIQQMDIVKKTVASGKIAARKEIEVKPQISGIVEKMMVEEGDDVQKGQVIAKIKLIPDLVRINDAQARLKKAQVSLEYAKKTHTRVKKRHQESFSSGKLSNQALSPNLINLNQAEAELKTAKLNQSSAENDYNRQQKLFVKQFITVSAFEDAALVLDKAKEAFQKSFTNYQMMKAKVVDTTEAELQESENSLKQARQELISSKNNLQLILDGISSLTPEKTNTLVRSTIDGMVLDIPVKEGESVIEINTQSSGTTIAIIADMADMIFEGSVDESEINKIRMGMDLILTIGAISDERFNAKIEHISPKGYEENGAVQFGIRAKVETNDNFFIRAGYSAGADIVLDKRVNVMAIEEGNLIFKDSKVYAEVQTSPNIFAKRTIEVGLSDGINIEILSGLSAEEKIKVQK